MPEIPDAVAITTAPLAHRQQYRKAMASDILSRESLFASQSSIYLLQESGGYTVQANPAGGRKAARDALELEVQRQETPSSGNPLLSVPLFWIHDGVRVECESTKVVHRWRSHPLRVAQRNTDFFDSLADELCSSADTQLLCQLREWAKGAAKDAPHLIMENPDTILLLGLIFLPHELIRMMMELGTHDWTRWGDVPLQRAVPDWDRRSVGQEVYFKVAEVGRYNMPSWLWDDKGQEAFKWAAYQDLREHIHREIVASQEATVAH
ncbi:hypothetical protein BDV95DRAFT_601721 [Massariosphaeria phaeospora]|uniref:Uncharacterized protein n=1 Tax=Massariosphaeria phaeospora TaxID=100035 RepID=A0A7C8IHH6_9PLEO|nr:hypothetical protein BDV95DRAFT_601721 [Massariosphaeria phaeospora]